MKKKQFLSFLLLLLLTVFSCTQEEHDGLPDDQLIRLMMDVHIAEAALQQTMGTAKDSLGKVYYEQIYAIHDISEEEFKSELRHLQRNPKKADKIYEQVLEELTKMDVKEKKDKKEKKAQENKKK